jgi:hypothetical protein
MYPPLRTEDIDHVWLLIWQNDLPAAGESTASALMTLEHHHNEAVAHRVVGLRQVDDAAIAGPS